MHKQLVAGSPQPEVVQSCTKKHKLSVFVYNLNKNKYSNNDYLEKPVLQTPGLPLMLLFFLPTHTDSLSGSNDDEKENVDPSVSIPAPSAPRK